MKKIASRISEFLSSLLVVFIGIILGVFFVLMLPFDYIKYKRSLYYKTLHRKYSLFSATGTNFKLYNEILKNGLPIRYIENPTEPSPEYGYFVFKNILIIGNVFCFKYDEESGNWTYSSEDEGEERTIISLNEYIENEIEYVNKLTGETICNRAVVLIDENDVDNVLKAKNDPRFLLYDDNREEELKRFCKNNM